jgi:hypothetical protein
VCWAMATRLSNRVTAARSPCRSCSPLSFLLRRQHRGSRIQGRRPAQRLVKVVRQHLSCLSIFEVCGVVIFVPLREIHRVYLKANVASVRGRTVARQFLLRQYGAYGVVSQDQFPAPGAIVLATCKPAIAWKIASTNPYVRQGFLGLLPGVVCCHVPQETAH